MPIMRLPAAIRRAALALLFAAALPSPARADAIDRHAALQQAIDNALVDLYGGRWNAGTADALVAATGAFGAELESPEARAIWHLDRADGEAAADALAAAAALGRLQARREHAAALEMLRHHGRGDVGAARTWRTLISLPKYAGGIEGALALQEAGSDDARRDEVTRLLAREYALWQITRSREKADALARLAGEGRSTPALIAARASEIQELSRLPERVRRLAAPGQPAPDLRPADAALDAVLARAVANDAARELPAALRAWRLALESTYPNLLAEADVRRRERLLLKLLRLVPLEYRSGVRDGEIVIPVEYREARSFTVQARQIANELLPIWRKARPSGWEAAAGALARSFDRLEADLDARAPQAAVEASVDGLFAVLGGEFGLSLKRPGMAADVVAAASEEVRSLLAESLAAAQAGQWRRAESLRLEAYITFDLEIENRALPRDPTLALRAEKCFLDGAPGEPGIKLALDRRMDSDALAAAYARALAAMEECVALVQVGLSPMSATLNAVLIVVREGLEAVVILAALLSGLQGPANRTTRRRIAAGAWLALGVSGILFVASRSLLQGLARHGEVLEAVISVLAVVVLLLVTNWVFHKYYWTGWNARLRELSKAAQRQRATRWETAALLGVGFTTIFREGFETTLFMQSLILEAGLRPVLAGMAVGGVLIAALGWAVFHIGARLPYRRMLVITGVLVVFVLFTFLGSTVRLFQTVGWLPVHPFFDLQFPHWLGLWLGIYPTWEGIFIPMLSFAYVGGAWLWVKFSARRAQPAITAAAPAAAAEAGCLDPSVET